MCTFPEQRAKKEEENRKLLNISVNQGVEIRDKYDRDAVMAICTSTMELLSEYMEAVSGRVCSTSRRAELEVWLGWIFALLYLDSAKEQKVWLPYSKGRFLGTGTACLRQCGQNDFEVVVPGGNPDFFLKVVRREGSSI